MIVNKEKWLFFSQPPLSIYRVHKVQMDLSDIRMNFSESKSPSKSI